MNVEATFGQIVKARRRDMGLTQEELARRVGCAPVTLRKIEYDDLRPSVQIAERLALALSISLEERAAFVRLARAERTASAESNPTPPPKLEEIGTEDLSGRAIRGYALGERIGQGGSGAVYRAIQPGVGREVAIKIILPQYANTPEFIRHFEVEAQFVARLEHPHIVPLYDFWREPNIAYLVMRLLRGGNLHRLLKGGPLQLDIALLILEQIGSALAAAHRAGIIHRDLKPSNVLLDNDHNAYLADFGIAIHRGNSLSLQPQFALIAGSPDYISPEQIRSDVVGPQTDIYGLGVMMYELLTGTVPFRGPTPIEIMHHHLNAPMPPLAANRGGLPKVIDRVIERATAKNPWERYPDVESLLADFRQCLSLERRVATPEIPARIASQVVTLTPADNPYKGLRAFDELDAVDFFGRESLTQQLLARLGEGEDLSRFLVVAGPSGSGKSSVVRAGLIPAIRRGALPGSENWFIVELLPGSNPLEELELALLRIAVNPPSNLIAWLRKDKRSLLRAVDRCLPDDPTIELVLVIDQFEELFTLVQDEAIRAHLLENLLTATLDEKSRLQIIITLRADFVDRLLNYVDFGELIRQRTEFVLPLTADEAERAIVGPAARVGLQIEAGVVSATVRDLSDQPGSLPLLQYALTELFEKREGNQVTKSAYQAIGGVLGALGRRAEDAFAGLDKGSQNTARQLFLRLVTLGEGVEDTRRRVLRSDLESLVKQNTEEDLRGPEKREIQSILDAFGRSRLLTFDRDPRTREPTIELAHEALIRSWRRLRNWLAEGREDLRIQRQLTLAAREWVHARNDPSFLATGARLARFEALAVESDLALNDEERVYLNASVAERQRRAAESTAQQRRILNLQRWVIGILTVGILVAAGLTIFARTQRNEALAQADIAFSRQLAAQALAEVQKSLGNDEYAALLAISSLNIQYDPIADAALVEAASKLPLKVFTGHSDELRSVAFSPDGKYVLTGGLDTTVKMWEAATGKAVQTFHSHEGEVYSVAFSPNGKYILSGSADMTAKLWEVASGIEILTLRGHTSDVFDVAFSADGQYMLTASGDGAVKLWEIATGQEIRTFREREDWYLSIAISPDGKYVLAGTGRNTASLWETATGTEIHTLVGHSNFVYSVAFSPNSKYLLTGSVDNTAKLWDAETGRELYTIRGHSSSVRSVAFSPDGKYILTGSADRTARLWDVATGQEVRSWRGHFGRVWSVAISQDGKYVLTGSADGTAKLWNFAAGEGHTLRGHTAEVYGTAFSPDGEYALTSSLDQTAKLWDIGSGQELRTFSGHDGLVMSVDFSPDAKYALTGGEDGTAKVWNVATGQGVHTLTGHSRSVNDAIFSSDGTYGLTGSSDDTAKLWDAMNAVEARTFVGHNDGVMSVAFSADGRYVLTASADTTAKVWDVATGEVLKTLNGHTDTVYGAAFSPDGKYILTGSADTTAKLWDASTGKELRTLSGHTNTVYDATFSPDGKYALTASADRTAKIWDVTTGAEVRTLSGHTSAVWSAVFSPDGKSVLTGGFDYTARVWEVNYRDFVSEVCARLLRDFTEEERAQAHIADQEPTCPQWGK
jgi:WD40 repeat protein/serine/threonine protein kinase/DNA-binding XRE family transcriptional regulator